MECWTKLALYSFIPVFQSWYLLTLMILNWWTINAALYLHMLGFHASVLTKLCCAADGQLALYQ